MVEIIIPVSRPDEKLEKLIRMLKCQTIKPSVVRFMMTKVNPEEDSRVKQLLEQMPGAETVPVEKTDFDHGGTRNLGASMAKADFMLFMTQDAVPVDKFLIERLLAAFQDETIASVYARQLASDEVGVIEHYTRQFNYPSDSFVKSKEDLERLGIKTYFCSNVCAMYRREVYKQLGGFVTKTIFNEDMILAASVIDFGYKIAYAADAKVIHAHKYTYWQQFPRNFDLAVSQQQFKDIFGSVKSESEGIKLVKQTMKYLIVKGKWYMLPDLVLQSGFKFLGYQFGKRYEKFPLSLVRKFSMNKKFWEEGKR